MLADLTGLKVSLANRCHINALSIIVKLVQKERTNDSLNWRAWLSACKSTSVIASPFISQACEFEFIESFVLFLAHCGVFPLNQWTPSNRAAVSRFLWTWYIVVINLSWSTTLNLYELSGFLHKIRFHVWFAEVAVLIAFKFSEVKTFAQLQITEICQSSLLYLFIFFSFQVRSILFCFVLENNIGHIILYSVA